MTKPPGPGEPARTARTLQRLRRQPAREHVGVPGRPLFSHDGKFVAVVHYVQNAKPGKKGVAVELWALEGPKPRKLLSEQKGRDVHFHKSGHQVAVAYNDGKIALFELPSGLPERNSAILRF